MSTECVPKPAGELSALPMSRHPELEHLARSMPAFDCSNATTTPTGRSQSRMSISHTKGLLNKPGQNNCFLNSAVQVLWHLDVFRRSFRELTGHACLGEACIFCALKGLFDQFQSSQESVIPPDTLRRALANTFCEQRRFQLGFMDDASECFENILLRIHYHLTNKEMDNSFTKCQAHCISHEKFGMNLTEQIVCNFCGAQSEALKFCQMIQYVSVAQCTQMCSLEGNYASFGSMLKLINSIGDVRNCPRMCGKQIKIKKTLINRPEIISIGLVWDSDHATQGHIENVFKVIETRIKLAELFDLDDGRGSSKPTEADHLNLVGLVTYYGKHYSTYLYNTPLGKWIYVDDATVVVIGPHWSQVVSKSIKNHFQPLLLLYANPNGTAVSTKTAFKQIVPMTVNNHKASSNKFTEQQQQQHQQPQQQQQRPPVINFDQLNGNKLCVEQNLRNERLMKPKEVIGGSKYYSDVPDSPSTNSTTSYFSDIGEINDGYISRKTVENVIKMQRNVKAIHKQQQVRQHQQQQPGLKVPSGPQNRSSYSSVDSFDVTLAKRNPNISLCTLQRRDSGNSSGERASSVSSSETPPSYVYRSLSLKVPAHGKKVHTPSKSSSDQGYDSFSISSADSYPTTNNVKKNQTLKQIPEDVYDGVDMAASMAAHKDQLASEVDRLLKKSYDMESEGDLLAAAALCDSAASKARQAIDMPYSNHQLLVSANMKYSECVMRSTRLHKRLLEKDAEERRILKEYHHSRQSSRDSTHGRHSRQNSRDNKDTLAVNKEMGKGNNNNNLEVYATLPKKNKANKNKAQLQTSAADLRCSGPIYSNVESIRAMAQAKKVRKEVLLTVKDSDFSDYYSEWDGLAKQAKQHQHQHARRQAPSGSQSCRENDSEVYGEVCPPNKSDTGSKKHCKVKRKLMFGNLLKNKNKSLPDLREDAIDERPKAIETKENTAPANTTRQTSVANIHSKGFHQAHRSFVAERGLTSKPSLVKVAPPLIRETKLAASTAKIERSQSMESRQSQPPPPPPPKKSTISSRQPAAKPAGEDLKANNDQNPFFRELNQKRLELQKIRAERMARALMPPPPPISHVGGTIDMTRPQESAVASVNTNNNNSLPNNNNNKKPSSHEIINFITRCSTVRSTTPCASSNDNNSALMNRRVKEIVNSMTARSDKLSSSALPAPTSIYSPIPVHAAAGNMFNGMTPTANYINQMRLNRPPDYETTLKRMTATNIVEGGGGLASNHNAINVPAPPMTIALSAAPQPSSASSSTPTKQKKKSVKFSDTVEMVATADADEDDLQSFLSNPLLKKVLGNREFPGTF